MKMLKSILLMKIKILNFQPPPHSVEKNILNQPVVRPGTRIEKPQKPETPSPPPSPERLTYDNKLIMQRGETLIKDMELGKYVLLDSKGAVIKVDRSGECFDIPVDEKGNPVLRDGDTLGEDGKLVFTPEQEAEYAKQKEAEATAREVMERKYKQELEEYQNQKETVQEDEFTVPLSLKFAYFSSCTYLFAGISVLVFGVFILIKQVPPGLAIPTLVTGTFIFGCFFVQCFPLWCCTRNRPVYHTVIIIIGGLIILFAVMVALIQVILSKQTWDFAVNAFLMNYVKYENRFSTEDSIKAFTNSGHYLNWTSSIVVAVIAVVCFLLAFFQCLCYVSRSWGLFSVCLTLPLMTMFLSIGMGILFVLLYPSVPFSKQDPVVEMDGFPNGCPAGVYLLRTAIINFIIAAGFLIYVIASCCCSCCYSHYRKHWPSARDTSYRYFKRSNYSLPFRPRARNTMAVISGVMGILALVAVIVNIPKSSYGMKNAVDFMNEYCGCVLSKGECKGKQEKQCTQVGDSIANYHKTLGSPSGGGLSDYVVTIVPFVESTRKLVVVGTFVSLLPVLGISGYCICILLVYIFYFFFPMEPDDTEDTLERDIADWNKRALRCKVYGEYISLVAEKRSLDQRIRRYNRKI